MSRYYNKIIKYYTECLIIHDTPVVHVGKTHRIEYKFLYLYLDHLPIFLINKISQNLTWWFATNDRGFCAQLDNFYLYTTGVSWIVKHFVRYAISVDHSPFTVCSCSSTRCSSLNVSFMRYIFVMRYIWHFNDGTRDVKQSVCYESELKEDYGLDARVKIVHPYVPYYY